MASCMLDGGTHWTWHCTSCDLLEYHTTRQCCMSLDLHTIGHVALLTRVVVGLAEVDMRQHVIIWLVECYAILLSVLYAHRWTRGCRELCWWTRWRRHYTLHVAILQVCDAVITCSVVESTGKDKLPYHFGHGLTDFLKELAWGAFDGAIRWMRWRGLCVVALTGRIHICLVCALHHWTCWKDMRCCTTKVQFLLPTLSSCICNGAVAVSTTLVCDRLVLAFHLSVAMPILSSRDLLLMQIQSVLFTLAFFPVESVDSHVKIYVWKKKTKYNDAGPSSSGLLRSTQPILLFNGFRLPCILIDLWNLTSGTWSPHKRESFALVAMSPVLVG